MIQARIDNRDGDEEHFLIIENQIIQNTDNGLEDE